MHTRRTMYKADKRVKAVMRLENEAQHLANRLHALHMELEGHLLKSAAYETWVNAVWPPRGPEERPASQVLPWEEEEEKDGKV